MVGPSEVPFAEGSDGPRCTFNPCNRHLVNLSDAVVEATCSLNVEQLHLEDGEYGVYDAWSDRALGVGLRSTYGGGGLRRLHLGFRAFEPKLLVLQPASRRR